MSTPVAWQFLHTVQVEEFLGQAGAKELYGPPRPVSCLITAGTKLVTNSEGREVTSTQGFICGPAEAVNEDDRVTIRGRETTVVATGLVESGGWPTPDNLEVSCA